MVAFDNDILNNTAQSEMDKKLAVKFYKKSIKNNFKSKEQDRNVYDDVDYISILIPGDSTTKIERAVKEDDKERFKIIWDRYLAKEDSMQNGTPLEYMANISPAEIDNFKGYQIHTIEQLAGLGEKGIQKIPFSRKHVDNALKFLDGNKYTTKLEERLKEMEAELAKLKEKDNEPTNDNTKRSGRDGAGGKSDDGNRKQRQVRKKVPSTAK
jgi:hypothetical protein